MSSRALVRMVGCPVRANTGIEDVYAGHRAVAVPHMINLSVKDKKRIFWDRSRDNVKA